MFISLMCTVNDNRPVLKMDGFVKFKFVVVFILSSCNRYSYVSAATSSVLKIGENAAVRLPCNHGFNSADVRINAIQWVMKGGEEDTPVANVKRSGKLTVERNDMMGRVNISYPEGDLKITNVMRTDANAYKCLLLVNGALQDTADWRQLEVLVPPEKFAIKCSASKVRQPSEDCSAIKRDKIMSLKCSAQSTPVSKILWIPPSNCSTLVNVTPVPIAEQLPDGLVLSGYVVTNLCEGEYCCHVTYEGEGMYKYKKMCQTVVREGSGEDTSDTNGTSPLTSQTRWSLYAIIGAVVLFLLLLLVIICCCCRYHRKHDRCLDVCSLPLHNVKKKVPVTVDINGDGDPETMALTPFLGPNHVGPNQPVFNFVIDEANEDPNVERVKVTQEIEPGGEKSRMVEIYKKKDSFLPADFKVPPGIFRRALSNSDVSKIVYKETVDETGRTKRELDIIKSDEREIEVESPDDLCAAGSAGSYQRQLSIHPSSSEGDLRKKVRFQRQDTVDSDDVDGHLLSPQISEADRRRMKYQQSVSVDIDDVD